MVSDDVISASQILVVDSERASRLVLCTTLRDAGYLVDEDDSGDAALATLEHSSPDLVVVAVQMSDMDGYHVCKAIRERYPSRVLPVLMITGEDDEESISLAYDVGATDFIVKPVNPGLLCQRARYLLRAQRSEQKNYRLAYFDSLTGLYNRESFKEVLNQSVIGAKRYQRFLSVLFLDLDDFKRINDTLGHVVGDLLLKAVAKRLRLCVRDSDAIMHGADESDELVARVGGDEFVLLLPEVEHAESAAAVARRILAELSKPMILAGNEVFVSPSIGISIFPQDADDGETLLKYADTAMYFAKRNGKNIYRFYNDAMNEEARRRLDLDRNLRQALEREEFLLHYQPQINVLRGNICGIEALLRWNSTEMGSITPAEFIPLAEENGLIVRIGEWVMREACRQAKQWQDQGLVIGRIAVNVSVQQFANRRFVESVADILAESGLDPYSLELEITEGLLLDDPEGTIATLEALKDVGVQLAMDDFGTGYSSLTHLKRLPIDRLKIDQSFVCEITSDPSDAAIAAAVTLLAESLDFEVIAEGVETDAQLAFLRGKGCNEMQGNFLSPPVTCEAMTALLDTHRNEPMPAQRTDPSERTVLFLDDDSELLVTFERALKTEGYRILMATTAGEAFDLFAKHQIQVVVADYHMPGMSGNEFLKRIKNLSPESIRIMLSGKSDLQSIITAVNAGSIYQFIEKPVSKDVLRRSIRKAFLNHDRRIISGNSGDSLLSSMR